MTETGKNSALLDATDKRILNLIQKDSQLSVKEVADVVGLSASPTYERIKRMERIGVIAKYVALLNKEKIERELVAICHVRLREHSQGMLSKFEKAIVKFDEVMEVQCLSGSIDYSLKVATRDMKSYQDFVLNKLSSLENIANVQSSFVMKEIKFETAYKLV
ncbi:MAG TPA: Lrp/AsnC family transcriptional regulator [Bacteroidia bacterium]|jgi:Lrp/AsnC family leucine-responsive transcriptional regulator|nr:Lrp/AsnC family transcriptional regulator [Bacteroidia bacterium]